MKKLVLKLDLHSHKEKQKAMSKVSGISGVMSVAIDMKDKKMVIGEVDAVEVTSKLRKICHTDIMTLGENKEENKDEATKGNGGGGGGQVVEPYPWFRYPYAYPQGLYAGEYPSSFVIY